MERPLGAGRAAVAETDFACALVRPDGHVCWATDASDAGGLIAALHRWSGAPGASRPRRAFSAGVSLTDRV